jgi:methionine-rich copper-binding protein CopC
MRSLHPPRPPIRPALALGVAIVAFLLVAPIAVLGHAELAAITPADQSSVSTVSEIDITFTEPLDPAKSSIRLVNLSGAVVAEGGTVDATKPTVMRLFLTTPLPLGTYTVRWTSASALDGDLDHGTTSFTAGAQGPIPGTAAPTDASASPSIATSSVPSAVPSAAPSAPPATPAASTSDAVIPVVVALIVLVALGLWLMRGRSRGAR